VPVLEAAIEAGYSIISALENIDAVTKTLENHDDVQNVYSNFEIDDKVMAGMLGGRIY